MSKLLTAAFLTTLMASTAFAQTDSGNTGTSSEPMAPSATGASEAMGPDWNQSIIDAFYEDASAAVVKSDEDLKTGWDSLTPEDQAMVEEHCSTMTADAGSSGSMPSTGGDTGSGSDAAASSDTGSSTMSGSDSSDMADGSGSGMEEDAGSSSSTMAETDTMESDSSGSDSMDSADSGAVDTESTTGSTSSDTGASAGADASGDASGADVELTAASVQQICTSIESF